MGKDKLDKRSHRRKVNRIYTDFEYVCYTYKRPKYKFYTLTKALEHLGDLKKRLPGKEFEYFKCEECGTWHVGTKETPKQKRIKKWKKKTK